jgi:hypothetical protein
MKRTVHIAALACAMSLAFTGCPKAANAQFSDSELDALENNLQADLDNTPALKGDQKPNYRHLREILEGDRERTVALILAAQKRKPTSARLWARGLGMIFMEDSFEAQGLPPKERQERFRYVLGYLQEFSQSLQSAIKANPDNPDLKLLSVNGSIALAAIESGEQLDFAKEYAEGLLKSNTDVKSWNYGNVIYDANAMLGRVALRQNDIQAARMYLLESGKTPGSPQLNTFGPNFDFDREMLEKGEKAVVLEHLELVSKFWGNTHRNDGVNFQESDAEHAKQLAQWKKEIEEGKIPKAGPRNGWAVEEPTLANGSFEENNGSLEGWTVFGNKVEDNPNVSIERATVHDGTAALKLFGQFSGSVNYSGVCQGLSVVRGERVRAKLFALVPSKNRIATTENKVTLKIEFYKQFGAQFGTPAMLDVKEIVIADRSTVPDVWKAHELTAQAPAGAVLARVSIVFIQPQNQAGAVYIDNVGFGRVDEASATKN